MCTVQMYFHAVDVSFVFILVSLSQETLNRENEQAHLPISILHDIFNGLNLNLDRYSFFFGVLLFLLYERQTHLTFAMCNIV